MTRVNVIALAVFVGLLAWVFTFDHAATRSVQSAALRAFAKLQRRGDGLRESLASAAAGAPPNPEQLVAENAALRKENAALRVEREEAVRLLEENNSFREMLGFERQQPWKLVPAKVIGRNVSTWWSTAVIDRGNRHGVAVDSPVVTDQGLVGKTVLVNSDEATVILLTDERCQVAARIEGTQERGILMGVRGATKEAPDLRLRYLSKDAAPPVGARVVSSNDGGLFPEGLDLGEVKSFEALDLSVEVRVKPSVDFAELRFVFVIERDDARASAAEAPAAPAMEEAALVVPKALPVEPGTGGSWDDGGGDHGL
jgi:rod shape-determining protein MreC